MFRILRVIVLVVMMMWVVNTSVWAAPYFYIDGPGSMTTGIPEVYYLRVVPDGNQLNTVSTVFNIPNGYFSSATIDITDNRSPTPTPLYLTPPPTPTLRPAHRCDTYPELSSTPDGSGNVLITCGFKNPNYSANGAFVARISLTASTDGNVNLVFDNSQSVFLRGTAVSIPAGISTNKSITIVGPGITLTPTPTVTPTGTLAPSPTDTPTLTLTPSPTGSLTPTPTAASGGSGDSYSLSASDVNFVTIAPFPTPTQSANSNDPLEVVEEDNTVPPPGDITPRPPATPFPTPDPNKQNGTDNNGEVLAVQSIRDLLIPGKSKADKNVVLFNFISVMTLLSIIIIIIWRILMLKRKNKLKQQHISDLINGELATLESKLSILKEKDGAATFQSEFEQTIDNIENQLIMNKKVKKMESQN